MEKVKIYTGITGFARPNSGNIFKYIARATLYASANIRFKLKFFKFPLELNSYYKYTQKLK
jgi:hypothetical protein